MLKHIYINKCVLTLRLEIISNDYCLGDCSGQQVPAQLLTPCMLRENGTYYILRVDTYLLTYLEGTQMKRVIVECQPAHIVRSRVA